MLETPVAFIIFKRPDTKRSLIEIKVKANQKLLADCGWTSGPEDNKKISRSALLLEQELLTKFRDWDWEKQKCYSEMNLGCKGTHSNRLELKI